MQKWDFGTGWHEDSVNSHMIGVEMLNYAGEKLQTALERTDMWNSFGGKRPNGDRWRSGARG